MQTVNGLAALADANYSLNLIYFDEQKQSSSPCQSLEPADSIFRAAAEIDCKSGGSTTRSAEHAHAELFRFCGSYSLIVGRAAEDSDVSSVGCLISRTEYDQAMFELLYALNCQADRVFSEAEDIAAQRGGFNKSRAEKAHAVLAISCGMKSVMLGIDDEARASRQGAFSTHRTAKAQAVLPSSCDSYALSVGMDAEAIAEINGRAAISSAAQDHAVLQQP